MNERIKSIKFDTKQPLSFVCVYLPCNGEKESYHTFVKTIEQLQEIVTTFQSTYDIIIGRDFNENAIQLSKIKRFHKFLQENQFSTRQTEPTFIHPNGRDVYNIDFFLNKSSMKETF